ncbi:hypothetical protein [Agrococcus sp. KRD186]|jgi:hypothetical protein|uniref:hypothetical protein n=1 Tax=Agrococcus sp. KRD186 TaxID=2729730 RepID=UPI0019D2CF8C|nr:hypothetical protein [Agrococcus sp. KRD186]
MNSDASCSPIEIAMGTCVLDPETGELVVGGVIAYPAPPVDEDGGGNSGGYAGPAPGGSDPNLYDPCPTWRDPTACARYYDTPPIVGEADPAPPDPVAADPVRAVTMADIARFTPLVGELVVEPEGWGVVGTPTNFYATAETHTMDGELFDTPIQVRWTPSSYRFDYGDGAVEETEAAGSAWRGAEESWTETATSHTYSTRDDVTASVTVIFTAEVDAGSGWFAVPGTLPVDAPAASVKVFEVDTVLTDGDCLANPSAAGCG